MKQFICKKEAIAPFVSRCARTVPNRPAHEILQCLKIQVTKKGECVIMASDNESEVMVKTMVEPPAAGFSICVPAKKLDSLLSSLPGESDISFTVEKQGSREMVILRSGSAEFVLALWPTSTFPSTQKMQKGQKVTLEAGELSDMLSRVSPMMANGDVRYYLNGVKLEISDGQLHLIATDGHRMTVYSRDLDESLSSVKAECIIPRQTTLEVPSLISGLEKETEVQMVIYPTHCRFITANFVITSKLIDGRYPDWRRVLPEPNNTFSIDKNYFVSVLRRSIVLSNEKFKGVRLDIDQDEMVVSSTNESQEKGSEKVMIQLKESIKQSIGFNIHYLLDAINNLEGPTIDFNFISGNDSGSALVTSTSTPEVLNVVMPIRL